MKKKVETYLNELERAIDQIPDHELIALVGRHTLTPETAKTYAFIETAVLNCVTYSGVLMTQPTMCAEAGGIDFAAAA